MFPVWKLFGNRTVQKRELWVFTREQLPSGQRKFMKFDPKNHEFSRLNPALGLGLGSELGSGLGLGLGSD